MLTKDQILAAGAFTPQKLAVPQWGGEVYVRPMSLVIADEFESLKRKSDASGDLRGLRVFILRATLCDELGKPLFTEADNDALSNLPSNVFATILDTFRSLNRLDREDVEDIAKN